MISGLDRTRKLIIGIITVVLLLAVCLTVDSAETVTDSKIIKKYDNNITITSPDIQQNVSKGGYIKLHNKSSYITVSANDKLYTDTPYITMWAKPSCGCRYSYIWHKQTFVNYCPHCHHYNCLMKNPKGVPENEYTCGVCGADYCGCCGKEKYSWSSYYLRR